MDDGTLIALVMITEGFLHYFPWRQYLKGRDLPRPIAYALGVSGLMLPFTAWLYERNEIDVIAHLWMVIVAGGISVLALYGLDAVKDLWWREREATEQAEQARSRDAK